MSSGRTATTSYNTAFVLAMCRSALACRNNRPIEASFAAYGFTLELSHPRNDRFDVRFCQKLLWHVNPYTYDNKVLSDVPGLCPRRTLKRLGYCKSPNPPMKPHKVKEWLYATAMSCNHMAYYIPVVGSVINAMRKAGTKTERRFFKGMPMEQTHVYTPSSVVSGDNMRLMYTRYGLDAREVAELCREIKEASLIRPVVPKYGHLLKHPAALKLLASGGIEF
jgi:hypothetical protein